MQSKNTRVYVDAVSGGICRLLTGDGARSFTVPAELLPDGVREGDTLSLVFAAVPDETGEATATLLNDLGDRLL